MSCTNCQSNPENCYDESLIRYTLQDDTYLFVFFCPPGARCGGRVPLKPTSAGPGDPVTLTVVCCDGTQKGPYDVTTLTQDEWLDFVKRLVTECIRQLGFCADPGCEGQDCPPPPPTDEDQPTVYISPAITVKRTCPSGDIFTYVLPSGAVTGLNEAAVLATAKAQAQANAGIQLMCLTALPEVACAGSGITADITVSGPSSSNNWSISDGSLPPGMTLTEGWRSGHKATLSGTPTTGGSYTFTIRVIGSNGYNTTRTYTICVIEIGPDPFPNATVGNAYSESLTASACATAPLSWQITAGALPDGLTLDEETGLISGTPTVDGTFNFTIRLQTAAT